MMASEDLRPPGEDNGEEEGSEASNSLGYREPEFKKAFQGAETSGSSMNFISFRKAGSASSQTNDYQTKESTVDITKLEQVGNISPAEVEEAKTLVQRIHINLKKVLNNPTHLKNSLTTNFSNSIQGLRANPEYLYSCVRDVNIDRIPPGFKTNFYGKVYEDGFLCEVRVKNIFFSIGICGNKIGARNKAIENCLRLMDIPEVSVDVRPRQWGNSAYSQLVLISQRMPRRVMPVFFQPPEGTKEHERAEREDERKKALKRKFNNEQISIMKNPNISHMGPPSSGINLENFVLIYKSNENPLSVLNTSAMFCKMGVDFYFEEIQAEDAPGRVKPVDNWICTAFVEGEAVADGKGVKKTLKQQVAVSVLECLGKICYSVLMDDGLRSVSQNSLMSRRDVKTTGETLAEGERLGEENVGNKMLQMMGWKEGEGLGRGDSIVDPIKVRDNLHRSGLGRTINSDNIQREEAEEIISKYAASDELDDLTFSSELLYDERREISMVAKKYGLVCRRAKNSAQGRRQTFLIISKKVGPETIIEQLEREGSWGRYELVRPVGDRTITSQYLHHQHLRPSPGFPQELQRLASCRPRGEDLPISPRQPIEIKPLLPNQPIVKRGKVSSEGLQPLMSGGSLRSPVLNEEDAQWERYRNMEVHGGSSQSQWSEKPWPRGHGQQEGFSSQYRQSGQQFQSEFPSAQFQDNFGPPRFPGHNYPGSSQGFGPLNPTPSGQFRPRMQGFRGRGRGWRGGY